MKKNIALGTLLACTFMLVGCGSTKTTTDDTSSNTQNTNIFSESTSVNDDEFNAQLLAFNGNSKLTLTGTTNLSNDLTDYYKIVAPETGKYFCGLKSSIGNAFKLSSHVGVGMGSFDISGKDEGYDIVLAVRDGINNLNGYYLPVGENFYYSVTAKSTNGSAMDYTMECFAPSAYTTQDENVTETTGLPNKEWWAAQNFTLDSNNSAVINGTANSISDANDVYSFSTPDTNTYTIEITHDNTTDFDIELKDSQLSSIATAAASPDSLTFSATSNEKYYLYVTAITATDNNYTITISN